MQDTWLMSFLFVPLIEDIPSSPDLFENCRINPEVCLKGKLISSQMVFDEKSVENVECISKYS